MAIANPDVSASPYTSIPRCLGYWKDAGVDVRIETIPGAINAYQALDAGKVDAVLSGSAALLASVEKGAKLKAYYSTVTKNTSVPYVPVDSDIHSLKDFEGKTIGGATLDAGTLITVRGMMKMAGADPGRASFVAMGTGADAMQLVKAGRVDVVGLWDGPIATMQAKGLALRPIDLPDFDFGFENPLVARSDEIDAKRKQLVGLARGVAEGYILAEENPEAAIRAHWAMYPNSKPTGVSDEEALAQAKTVLAARLANAHPVNDVRGLATDDQVENLMTLLTKAGALHNSLSVGDVWTSDLVKSVNDGIDLNAFRQQARELKFTGCK